MIFRKDDIIVNTISRILIPFIQIYALYVIMHGHYSPGGGFQGGVILGASLVLLLLTRGYDETRLKVPENSMKLFSSAGVLIYAGVGLLCLFFLGNFLDYSKLAILLHVDPAQARSLGILAVEIGVGFAVMAVMYSIFLDISTGGVLAEDEEEE
jgi:multicomponent Na+:H+ antiporter subunit B